MHHAPDSSTKRTIASFCLDVLAKQDSRLLEAKSSVGADRRRPGRIESANGPLAHLSPLLALTPGINKKRAFRLGAITQAVAGKNRSLFFTGR